MRSLKIGIALCFTFSFLSFASAQDAGVPVLLDGGMADRPPSTDVISSDLQPAAPEVGTIVPIVAPPVPPPAPPVPSVDMKRFEELNSQVAALARQNELLSQELGATKNTMALIQDRLSLLEGDARYKLAAAGLGPSFATGGDSGAAVKLQANLKGFSAFYYLGMGGGVALSMVIHMNRVRVSPFGFGVMIYRDPGHAFTSCWIKRSVDIALPLSVDVRVWKGVTVGAQIAWFIPNPVDIAIAGKEAGEESADKTDTLTAINAPKETSNKVLDDSGEVVSRAFGDAFKSPRIELVAKWTFE